MLRDVRAALKSVQPGSVLLLAIRQPPPGEVPQARRGLGLPLVVPYVAVFGGGTWTISTSHSNMRALPRGVSLDALMRWFGRGEREVLRISAVTAVETLYMHNATTDENTGKGSR